MSANLKHCFETLKVIAKIKNHKLRKAILREFRNDECLYRALKEIAVNTVNRNIKLTPLQIRKLRTSKKIIKQLSLKAKDRKKKRRLVVQSGGFLPILIPAVISIISEIIRNAS